ncbi:MAG: HEAT repeat domain-containing protein [Deltaproteobacteria bacterium]|nr:HEAT repeat domain-containing protein [Deltaproteobacteria bacterium]
MNRRPDRPTWLVCGLVALGVAARLAIAAGAEDRSVDVLVRQLREDPSFKVRLSAALGLGRLADRRAIPALLAALDDQTPSVRAVALGALAKLIDRSVAADLRARAIATVERLARDDPDPTAQKAAVRALEPLAFVERAARPRELRGATYTRVEMFDSSATELGAAAVAEILGATRDQLLAGEPTFVTDWPGAQPPTPADLKKAGVRRAVTVIVQVEPLRTSPEGDKVRLTCEIKLILAGYPGKAIRSLISGAGRVVSPTRPEAMEEARATCTNDVLTQLLVKQMIPAIQAASR